MVPHAPFAPGRLFARPHERCKAGDYRVNKSECRVAVGVIAMSIPFPKLDEGVLARRDALIEQFQVTQRPAGENLDEDYDEVDPEPDAVEELE